MIYHINNLGHSLLNTDFDYDKIDSDRKWRHREDLSCVYLDKELAASAYGKLATHWSQAFSH